MLALPARAVLTRDEHCEEAGSGEGELRRRVVLQELDADAWLVLMAGGSPLLWAQPPRPTIP